VKLSRVLAERPALAGMFALLSMADACSSSSAGSTPDSGGAADSGIVCDASAPAIGNTLSFGSPLPDLAFAGDSGPGDGGTGNVSLRSFAIPCAPTARIFVLRVVTGWCGTCRWHSANTDTILPGDVASRVQMVDLLLANDDNQLASATDLASYRAHGDGQVPALADPAFTLAPFFDPRPALPLYLIVDARTLTPVVALSNPSPDSATAAFRRTLAELDGQPPPVTAPAVTHDGRFTRDQWDMIRDMRLIQPPPSDPTNHVADDPKAAALGFTLFETSKLSPQQVGCRSCHNPALLLTDGKEVPPEGAKFGTRNVPSIVLASYRKWLSWAGVADSLWMLSILPVELDFEYASSRLFAAHAIFANYRTDYEAIFGAMPPLDDTTRFPANGMPGTPEWTAMAPADQDAVTLVLVNMGKSVAAYLRSLRVTDNALDAYANGETTALTAQQKDGLLAYFSAGCAQCHYGPRLTDDSFHNLRFPTGRPDRIADTGRSDGIPFLLASEFRRTGKFSDFVPTVLPPDLIVTPNLVGAFKTPDLRGVAFTLPYGHGGTYGGLTSVIEAHRTSGLPADSTLTTGDAERFLIPFDADLEPAIVDFLNLLRIDMVNPPP
jgi:cytochrome c peroxidase